MALGSFTQNINYLEDDTGVCTRINIFKYQRPTPNAKLLKVPVSFLTLPLPVEMPTDDYSMNIRDVDLGAAGLIGNLQNGETLGQLNQTLSERLNMGSGGTGLAAAAGLALGAGAPGILDMAGGAAALLGGKKGLAGAVSADILGNALKGGAGVATATLGMVKNPHTALLFNNVNLRTFTFHWKLSPRSAAQSEKIDNIINTIKRAMHPSLALGGFALDYPNLFTVEFNNNKEGIVELGYSFCQDFKINPTPNGHVYYRGGYPAIYDITMTLKEFQIKTAENFQNNTYQNALAADARVK
jgi:hypothetical protein